MTKEENRGTGVLRQDSESDLLRSQIVSLLPRLRRFAIALTGTVADGDDLVQDTVERALKNLHQWERGTRMDSWMFRIAKNRYIDTRRSAKRAPSVSTDNIENTEHSISTDGASIAENRLTLARVLEALQTLPDEQREAAVLVLIEGFSYKEAAEFLEIPIGTITSRIARAREALSHLIED